MTNVKYPVEVLIEALDAQATWVPSGPAGVMHRASDMLRTIPYLHSEISRHLARTTELTEYSRKLEAALDAAKNYVALLENSADGYYNVEASDEAKDYKTALLSARKDSNE